MEVVGYERYPQKFMQVHQSFNYGYPRKPKMLRTQSFDEWNRASKMNLGLRRGASACFAHNSSEEDFMKNLQELALQCHEQAEVKTQSIDVGRSVLGRKTGEPHFGLGGREARNLIPGNSFSWPSSVGERANGIGLPLSFRNLSGNNRNDVGLPLSLKMLKKKQCRDREKSFTDEAKPSASCSMKRAFSSMVFIIKELQAYALQMRQTLLCEDFQEVLGMVQRELQASFVWLFQQVFSSTPTLMVSLMVLLANFTVYSISDNVAVAAIPSVGSTTCAISIVKEMSNKEGKFTGAHPYDQCFLPDDNVVVPNLLSLCNGLGGGGHKSVSTAGEAEGDSPEGSSQNHVMFVEDNSMKASTSSLLNPHLPKGGMAGILGSEVEEGEGENENSSDQIARDTQLWQSFMREFTSDSTVKNPQLDHGTMKSLMAPITVQLEPENYICYDRTELLYQNAIRTDPDNVLLLSNYAQFIHLVRHDNIRAEEYFRKAMRSDSVDGEAIVRFANFLWLAKGDLSAAEKTYVDAIQVDPKNPFCTGSYAHFLWHTGGAAESSYSDIPTI